MKKIRFKLTITLIFMIFTIIVVNLFDGILDEELSKIEMKNYFYSSIISLQNTDLLEFNISEENIEKDYDGDGLSNMEELGYGTSIFNLDTNGNGIFDNIEVANIYEDAIDYTDIPEADYNYDYLSENSFYDVTGIAVTNVKSGEYTDFQKSAYIESYNGFAFDTFEKLSAPYIVHDYAGDLYIEFNRSKDDSLSDKYIALVTYNIEKDKYSYEIIGFEISAVNTAKQKYSGEIYVTEDMPSCLCIFSSEEECKDMVSNLSMEKSYVINNSKTTYIFYILYEDAEEGGLPAAVMCYLDDDTASYSYINYVQMLNKVHTKSGIKNYFTINSYAMNLLDAANLFMTSEEKKWNLITDNVINEFPDLNNIQINAGKALARSNLHLQQFEGTYSELLELLNSSYESEEKEDIPQEYVINADIATKKGIKINTVSTDFSIKNDTFNFVCISDNDVSYAFGIADIIANYYNYGTIPCVEDKDVEIIDSMIDDQGINLNECSKLYSENFKYYYNICEDKNINDYIYALSLSDIQGEVSYEQKSSDRFTVISYVLNQLNENKVLVADIVGEKGSTSVVIYGAYQMSSNPNIYKLKVYDPNFYKNKICLYDEDGNIIFNQGVDTEITVYKEYEKSVKTTDDGMNLYNRKVFKFEYGSGDYYWGNTENASMEACLYIKKVADWSSEGFSLKN